MSAELLAELDGTLTVLADKDISERYHSDWTFVDQCCPDAVLCPASTDEVAAILRNCHNRQIPVVVQGGLTGLAGGAIPSPGEVAISLEKLSGIEELDEQAMTMTVRAGTPLQAVQEAAAARGLLYPVDLGARGSATIGGNLSTNAGGVQVIRYGMTRAMVLGLEVVLPDGTVITSLNKMLKNNAGYDLKHLFIGAEGTLGVVTRVVLRLFPKPVSRCTALIALDSFAAAVTLLQQVQKNLAGLVNCFEVMWDNFYCGIAETLDSYTDPFEKPWQAYVILELAGNHQQRDGELLEAFLSEQLEQGLIGDVVIAQNDSQADRFWSVRHGIGEYTKLIDPVINYDISIPIGDMDRFSRQLQEELRRDYPHISTVMFGHIGDSNLHVVIGHYREGEFGALKDYVHRLTGEYHGSVSAEHGIGKLKTDYLPLSRSEEEICLMRLLKKTLDPHDILNRGRVLTG